MGERVFTVLQREAAPLSALSAICSDEAADYLHCFLEKCQVAALLIPGRNAPSRSTLIAELLVNAPQGVHLSAQTARTVLVWILVRMTPACDMDPLQFHSCCASLRRLCSGEDLAALLRTPAVNVEGLVPSGTGRPMAKDARVERARTIVDSCYQSARLNERHVSSEVGLSPSRFGRLVRTIVGLSFRDYVRVIRIQAATRLLVKDELPIGVVARRVGYSYAETFDRDFRGLVGMTPRMFRSYALRTAAQHVAWSARNWQSCR